MRKLFVFLKMAVLAACLMCCKDSLDDDTFSAYEEQPVGIYLSQKPEYSEWVKLLKKTDLYNALNINMDFTCFIAENSAVADYLKIKGYASVDDIPMDQATYLMRYHIIPGTMYKQSAFSGKLKDSTASGDYLTVVVREGGANALYVNDTALITVKDIEVINGCLHKLNSVLDPITRTVWDVLNETDEYSIFRDAVKECGLQEWLTTRSITEDEVTLRDYKTLFVVSNTIFKQNGINSLAELHQKYSGESTDPESQFYKYIAYHIINTNSDFADLATFSSDSKEKSKTVATKAELTLIKIEEMDDKITAEEKIVLNRTTDSVHLISGKYDQQCMNGFVHEINKLMEPPFVIEPTTVTFDLCDIDACRKLEFYGKVDDKSISDQSNWSLDRETAKDIEWYTVPDNDGAVRYQIRRDQTSWAPNKDLLMLNLGYVGWVKIRTPLIAKGTYKVNIYKFGYSTVRGKCQMYLDEKSLGPVLDFNTGGGNNVELGVVEFTENARHIVKFSAVKKGVMEMDRIVFTPVKN